MTQPTTLAAVTQDIIGFIESETDGAAGTLTADSGLQDAGMDSARVLSLVFRIEARYDIELDAAVLPKGQADIDVESQPVVALVQQPAELLVVGTKLSIVSASGSPTTVNVTGQQ